MSNNEDNLLQENSISTCFWNQFIHQANGQGIVISVGEGQVEDVVRLIKVLRYLKNLLPIEIVHKGDLSQGSQDWIIRTSRTTITISEDFLIDDSLQDIWFVDASKAIHPLYIEVFKRFSNKWIASLFNSFDEMVLMDSDTVPFVPPEHFLNMESRKLKGALFFKDRAIGETISSSDVSFYKELLPSVAEWKLFNLSMATEITMDNAFFKHKQKHVMESGVVVLQRSTHLLGLLISTVLQLKKATSSPIYGDKELFWLGQSIAGNEDYTFNSNSAGAVGVVKDDIYKDFYSICSTQVAHFDSHKTLLWLNGGLKVCKKPSWQRDYAKQKHLRKTFKSVEELKENYQSSMQINGAIIPNNVEYKFLKKPSRGFKKNPSLGCSGYFWCAFTHVDDYEDYVIRYTQEEIRQFDIIIKIWSS
ncbi:uncharacterized protein KQ657_004735 [Scheffersomyces spartinae]|uniref:Uncharacterized protein n=1 Tax=Scheffersomyces spartinae TaxID=45513 RepID=A0A9P8AJ94_9ASCO|nr:uncharacterized protein KQ657_004735 [Scheffersomyces spartinae]KAG7194520.1 hypothetical protein KQ657_004735 [Scheffersomyces spartinae]